MTKRPITIPDSRRRHAAEEKKLVRAALVRNNWSLAAAARELGVAVGSLQSLIVTHEIDEYREHAPGKRGRPKKKEG